MHGLMREGRNAVFLSSTLPRCARCLTLAAQWVDCSLWPAFCCPETECVLASARGMIEYASTISAPSGRRANGTDASGQEHHGELLPEATCQTRRLYLFAIPTGDATTLIYPTFTVGWCTPVESKYPTLESLPPSLRRPWSTHLGCRAWTAARVAHTRARLGEPPRSLRIFLSPSILRRRSLESSVK